MSDRQTLVVYSGHPLGLFESAADAPRVIATNGLLVGMYDNQAGFTQAAAMGVSNYGQMTAGGWMYIGPQGIVHGTYLTLLNAGRMYLDIPAQKDLAGVVYLSSGLGGMSGAQAKAVEIAGGIGVLAEVDYSRIETRQKQGWVSKISSDLDKSPAGSPSFASRKNRFPSPIMAMSSTSGSMSLTTISPSSWLPTRPPATMPTAAATRRPGSRLRRGAACCATARPFSAGRSTSRWCGSSA